MNTKKILTQIKRELWENKIRFVYAPIVTTLLLVGIMGIGVVKLSMSFGERGLHFNGGATIGGGASIENKVDMQAMLKKIDADGSNVYDMVVSGATFANTSLLAILFLFVLLAYAHGCLFDDRKNKDILFWRSLPVSETSNVLVKLGILLFYVPTLVLALNIVVGVVVLIGATAFFSYHGVALNDSLGAFVHSSAALIAPKIFLSNIFSFILLLPVIGFMLVSSAWAKKSPFLFSSVLPVGLVIIDVISQKWFGINLHVIDTLTAYWVMFAKSFQGFAMGPLPYPNGLLFDANLVFGLLLSMAIGAAFVTGSIWLRNNRYEI
jgi:ABC-2 type transport system permease protein